jgi:hypothetical protein
MDILSVTLLWIQLILWLKISLNSKFVLDEENMTPVNVLQHCSKVAAIFETHAVVSSISMGILFIRMMQYFTFAKKLYQYTEILSSAMFDMFFFSTIWCVMLVGFSIYFMTTIGTNH